MFNKDIVTREVLCDQVLLYFEFFNWTIRETFSFFNKNKFTLVLGDKNSDSIDIRKKHIQYNQTNHAVCIFAVLMEIRLT